MSRPRVLALTPVVLFAACGGGGSAPLESEDGAYEIVGTYTDQFDFSQGKANVEDVLTLHPDLAACVGLFGYNPPLILEALKVQGRLGEVKVIAFDEDDTTLQGIVDGTVVGTVVQDPYRYGKESVRILAGLAGGSTLSDLGVDEQGVLDIPGRVIGPDEVEAFWNQKKHNLETATGGGPAPSADGPRIAFITNGVADFWTVAEAGAIAGGAEFGARVDVLMPSGGITEQKSMVEDCLVKGLDGIAISPINPANQVDLITRACEATRVITHDSDAPGTDRLCYIGMDNYAAGYACGELVREALPAGGKVAIFIGRLEQDNADRRWRGTRDAILGLPYDPDGKE